MIYYNDGSVAVVYTIHPVCIQKLLVRHVALETTLFSSHKRASLPTSNHKTEQHILFVISIPTTTRHHNDVQSRPMWVTLILYIATVEVLEEARERVTGG